MPFNNIPIKNPGRYFEQFVKVNARKFHQIRTDVKCLRCWSLAREVGSRWLCRLQSPGGMTTGWDPHPAGVKQAGISHQRGGGTQQKIKMTHFHPVAKNNDTQEFNI